MTLSDTNTKKLTTREACPICLTTLEPTRDRKVKRTHVQCAQCGAIYHVDCWQERCANRPEVGRFCDSATTIPIVLEGVVPPLTIRPRLPIAFSPIPVSAELANAVPVTAAPQSRASSPSTLAQPARTTSPSTTTPPVTTVPTGTSKPHERTMIGVPLNIGGVILYLFFTFASFFIGFAAQYVAYRLLVDKVPLEINRIAQYVPNILPTIAEADYISFAGVAIALATGIVVGFALLWQRTRGSRQTTERFVGATFAAIVVTSSVLYGLERVQSGFGSLSTSFLILTGLWVGRFMLTGLARRPLSRMLLSFVLGLIIEIGYQSIFEGGLGQYFLSWIPFLVLTSIVPWLPSFLEPHISASDVEHGGKRQRDTIRALVFRTVAIAIWPEICFFLALRTIYARTGRYDDGQTLLQALIPSLIVALTASVILRIMINNPHQPVRVLPGLVGTLVLAGSGCTLAFLASPFGSSAARFTSLLRTNVTTLQVLVIGLSIAYCLFLFFSARTGMTRESHTRDFSGNFAAVSFYLVLIGAVVVLWGRPFFEVVIFSVGGSLAALFGIAIATYLAVAPIWWADSLGRE